MHLGLITLLVGAVLAVSVVVAALGAARTGLPVLVDEVFVRWRRRV
ncbi:hypothetical protein [Gaiella sp.]